MIELLEKGYMHISFSGIINDITGLTDKIPDNKLISWFKELFFDPGKNTYTEQSFSKTDKYMFLKKPFRVSTREYSGRIVRNIYYKESEVQNCILSVLAINSSGLYSFFHNVEKHFEKYKESVNKELERYDRERIEKDFLSFPNTLPEAELVKEYWEIYLNNIEKNHIYIALGMLILASILNVNVIYFIPAIKKNIAYKPQCIQRLDNLTNKKVVMKSALSDNLFVTQKFMEEPQLKNCAPKGCRLLFTSNSNGIDISNAVFKIISADKNDVKPAKDDKNFGDISTPVGDLPLKSVVSMLSVYEHTVKTSSKLKKLKKFHIMAVVPEETIENGKKSIKENEYYLSYIHWYKESRLVLRKEKSNKSYWYINMDKEGKCEIIPYGTLQYNAFTIDIPNATTTTFDIPLWLFVRNNTPAQRFVFNEVID